MTQDDWKCREDEASATLQQETTIYKAIVECRSQRSRGSSGGRFGGPNSYWAVQCVPAGVEPLKTLSHTAAEKRGIVIVHTGEGYSNRVGPRSMFHAAKIEAERIASDINAGVIDPRDA